MQIGRLEEHIVQKLFERARHGMAPTAAARQMYRLFLPIVRDCSNAEAQMLSNGEAVRGHVKIGLIASITEGVLIDTLSEFSNKYPEVDVTVSDGYTSTLADWVTGGHLDAAVVNKPRGPLALDLEHIVDMEMRRVVGVSHPLRPLNPATKLFMSMLGGKPATAYPGRVAGRRSPGHDARAARGGRTRTSSAGLKEARPA